MTHQEILELIAAFDRSTLETLRVSREETTLEMSRSSAARLPLPGEGASTVEVAAPASASTEHPADCITAPLVGTFYTASAPDQPPFVTEGVRVQKGQTVGLIEAMKMMSEVTAPCECIIDQILVKNAELVAFGTPLFSYTPC